MGIPLMCGLMLGYHHWSTHRFYHQLLQVLKISKSKSLLIRSWDDYLLHGLFNTHEVSSIKSIPLCHTSVTDMLIWPFTSSGVYTIKLGYNFLAKENFNTRDSGHSRHDSETWKLIWALDVPNKVKNFTWRSCRDTVPEKKNLKKRQILHDDTCDHCGQVKNRSYMHFGSARSFLQFGTPY